MTEPVPEQLVRSWYAAYHAADRAKAEALLHADFTFTSPYDDHIDRAAWFERCWPGAGTFRSFAINGLICAAQACSVTYDARAGDGQAIRNTEVVRLSEGQVRAVEVFFGRPGSEGAWTGDGRPVGQ